ncbi:putative RNA-directed DNA polymerase from transposon BS [Trichonephila clavipes]|uniref:Putative RNA-directed DNA polymerase from transposon BS n=1 Tax=Trichonephila clavipes TaxID=2585209 RepID=A0A8X6RXQ3_TRICX|nr:putative RNA-directed DNA polymerase from transposon BS [Trichonephila clavipes]
MLETGVECSIYADDIFIYSSHQSFDIVCRKLQNTLERRNQWCNYWKLNLSPVKSTIAELSNKRIHSFPNVLLAGTRLPWQSSIKYLGVYFSKWNQNTNITHQLKNKALKKFNALKGLRGASNRGMCRSKGGEQTKRFLPSSNNFMVTYPGQTIADKNIGERLSTADFRAATVGNADKGF